ISALGLNENDVVEIEGGRKTVAIVKKGYPSEIGEKTIRMDGILRTNADISLGEVISLRKVDCKEAKSIILAPGKKGAKSRPITSIGLQKANYLLRGKAVIRGDQTLLNVESQISKEKIDKLPEEIEEAFGGFPFRGNFSIKGMSVESIPLVVVETNPKNCPVIISEDTKIVIKTEGIEVEDQAKVVDVTYSDIGGLKEEINKVREMIEIPLKHPEVFHRLGIDPPAGVLLHGPPGSGKTLLARAVANESDANFILLNGPEIMNKFYGESEKKVRELFEEAEKNAPSIIFIDEIDSIASKRDETQGEVEKRVVSTLLTMMDGLSSRGKVVVIGATNRPNALDPALRRPGRFDREIEIGVPNKEGRLEILKVHTRSMPLFNMQDSFKELSKNEKLDEDVDKLIRYMMENSRNGSLTSNKEIESMISKYLLENPDKNKDAEKKFKLEEIKKVLLKLSQNSKIVRLPELADITHGFVGADLTALCKEAAMNVLRKVMPDLKAKKKELHKILEDIDVKASDFRKALNYVRPSAMREVLVETPNIGWDDIGGLEILKQELKEAVEWPLKHPESFKRLGIRPPRGILLHGPPGTGKTLLAKAVAKESEANFIQIKGPALLNKWVGESEKGVRKIFEKARQVAPTIIFFDELDAIAPRRGSNAGGAHVTDNVVNTMLAEMDGLEELNEVVIIAATNRIDILDPAILRPGRFDRLLLTGTPDLAARKEIFKIHTKNMPLAKDVDLDKLAEKTDGYVGSGIEAVCREAAMLTLREDLNAKEVKKKYFDAALKKVKPSVTKEAMAKFKEAGDSVNYAEASLGLDKKERDYFG
ncbi:MAG: CDC48 family AAA ATPase, partial [Nanoarchaeota archaeon]|nr:CDC48 family AAA ATPase [Nanoarchaeota archaeon]